MIDFRWFRSEVKKQLELRSWKPKDLAEATGYSLQSIQFIRFFADTAQAKN